MPKLTPISAKRFLKILQKQKKEYYVYHQTGSRMILSKDDIFTPISLPMHNRDMNIGFLHSILK